MASEGCVGVSVLPVVLFLLVKSFDEGFKFLLDLTDFLCRHASKAKVVTQT